MDGQKRYGSSEISRRALLRWLAGGSAAALLAACGNATPPTAAPTPAAGSGAAPRVTATSGSAAAVTGPPPTPTIQITDRTAASGRKTTIEVYSAWSGDGFTAIGELAELYEKSQPDIGVKVVFAGALPDNETKTFAAVAGGRPPDIAWVDGPQVSSWAVQGVLQPLDQYIQTAGLKADDYWAPSWRQNLWKDKTYALTLNSDANFGFVWNKGSFKEVDLDPEKPPTTVDEMTRFSDQLTKIEGNRVLRLGMIPWTTYGSPNSMYTWGWVFGGEFYDEASGKITADHPGVVAALEWMVEGFAKKYDPTRLAGFQAGFGQGETGPFYQGQTAMQPLNPTGVKLLGQFKPNLQYGVTYMPTGPGGARPRASWVGGWCAGIPKGAKNPEAAFQFLNFMAGNGASGTGVKFLAQRRGLLPGYKKSDYYPEVVEKEPVQNAFLDILKEARHQRPVVPVQAFYSKALGKALDDAVFGGKNPKEVLAEATNSTQRELETVLRRYGN